MDVLDVSIFQDNFFSLEFTRMNNHHCNGRLFLTYFYHSYYLTNYPFLLMDRLLGIQDSSPKG